MVLTQLPHPTAIYHLRAMTSLGHAASNHLDVRILVSPLPVVPNASPAIPPPVDDYPDCLLCPLTLFPPEHPVYLDIPDSNGGTSRQVYEHDALYRMISTIGTCRQSRRVTHALNGQSCDRREALGLVREVPVALRARVVAERERRSVDPNDDPLTADDRAKYEATMRRMEDV
jgi:hypothetical protein